MDHVCLRGLNLFLNPPQVLHEMSDKMKKQTILKVNNPKEEALKLLHDITDSTKHVSSLINKTMTKLQEGYSVADGISLMDVKSHLFLSYLTDVTYLMSLKTSGKSIAGDSSIDRLIEGRVVLERIRPIEQKLKYQIDKLLKIASTGAVDADDPSRFRANPSNMISKFDDNDESEDEEETAEDKKNGTKNMGKKSGVYVPPKVAPVHYDGDETKAEREQRLLERARKFALNSSLVQELKEEYLDTPTEIRSTNSLTQKLDAYQKRKEEYEETYFTRLPITKSDKQRSKKLSTLGVLGDEVTKFEDISALDGTMPILKSSKKRKSKSQMKKKGKKKRKKFH